MGYPQYLIELEDGRTRYLSLKEAREAIKSGASFGRQILDRSGHVDSAEPEDIKTLFGT